MKNSYNRYDMSTVENREKTVRTLCEEAKVHKADISEKFRKLDEYYHNQHYTKEQITQIAAERGWDFVPPVLPDPFIQVESQIDPIRPDFEFKGRDNDLDSQKAKVRQDVVNFILYNNKTDDMMPTNERHSKKLGDAFWKIAFDGSITGPGFIGDITIGNPSPANIFPDPSAYDLDDCEYVDYIYRIHERKAWRTFNTRAQRDILSKIKTSASHGDTEIFTREQSARIDDHTYQVVEHWYRDDDGDIACSVQVEYKEVQWIKKYWKNTRNSGNKMYPFVMYCDIPNDQSFWDIGEIEMIFDLVDTADREFLMAVLHDMFSADDLIVCEDDALKDGTTINKSPDGIVWVKPNKKDSIKRLGGLASNINALQMIEFIKKKIQETNGNFDPNQGNAPPANVKTLGGMQLLNEQGNRRTNIKKADRETGFRRLYELIDWTALEFYNTERMIMIRGKSKSEQDRAFSFNSDSIRTFDQKLYTRKLDEAYSQGIEVTPEMEQEFADEATYYPRIDAEIITTDAIRQSKALMTQATSDIANQLDNINPAKAELIKSNVETLGLPNEQEIKQAIDQSLQPQMGMLGIPQQGMPQGQQIHPVDQVLQALSPEQRDDLLSLPQDKQVAIIRQIMGG